MHSVAKKKATKRRRTPDLARSGHANFAAIRARKVDGIGGRLDFATLAKGPEVSAHYRINADIARAYLLKGACAETGLALGLPRSGEGGPIIGKHAGWTENIGEGARKGADW